jgi:hypothetical protein
MMTETVQQFKAGSFERWAYLWVADVCYCVALFL